MSANPLYDRWHARGDLREGLILVEDSEAGTFPLYMYALS